MTAWVEHVLYYVACVFVHTQINTYSQRKIMNLVTQYISNTAARSNFKVGQKILKNKGDNIDDTRYE